MLKTTQHFLRGFSGAMNRLPDPRRDEQCVYTQAHLLWLGALLFLMHLGSRRQMRFERLAEAFMQNLAKLSGQNGLDTVADPDTLAYYAEHVPVPPVEKLLAWITARLIRIKALDPFRLLEYFPVAIDGSQICLFEQQPWPGCPHRELSNAQVQYFAYVLDAKLVTPCGMALSLATEMLSNEGGRLRWKIENEGFNVQKNDGYEMEHPYSEHPNAFKIFCLLLLMAHYLSQLILHGSLIRTLAESFGSARNFARRLAESMRNHLLPDS
ncbi:hypothetical protein ACFLSJ_07255, partial [Verrucomicrobiota bacterium]